MSLTTTKIAFKVRQQTLADADNVLTLAKDLTWRMGKYEPHIMAKMDAGGIWVAEEEKTGEFVGMLSGIIHSPSFASIGEYAVKEKYRGQGIGHALWAKMWEHIDGNQRNVSLFGETDMEPIYQYNLGFSVIYKQRALKYGGIPEVDNLIQKVAGVVLGKADATNIEKIIDYDAEVIGNGMRRSILLTESMKLPEDAKSFYVAMNETTGQVVGYCLCVVSQIDSILIQPLYADNQSIAQALLYKCLTDDLMSPLVRKNGIWLQVWAEHSGSQQIINKLGPNIELLSHWPSMFTKEVVHGDINKIFATISPMIDPF